MSTNPIASSTGAATTGTSSGAAKSVGDASDRFLTLLVTQLRNQDPLNPLDNAQVTSQLAQLSTVSGINRLNETVAALSASFAANQYLQAASLVGREVTAPGAGVLLDEGKGVFGVAVAADADAVKVSVRDAAGNVVRTFELGATKPGVQRIEWDGKTSSGDELADGLYTIDVVATMKGEAVAAEPLSIGKVSGVSRTDAGTVLSLGALGTVALADALEIN
jgi:flagellar basal-body rod modification protein FlgD